jgi:CheY-like chemotaxis protein
MRDGIDIAEIINIQYQLPFIFLTSHADKQTLERAKKQNLQVI